MAEVVTFPDVQALVVGFLKAQFAALGESAKVAGRVPSPAVPARFVRVDVGSANERNRVVAEPLLILQAYAKSEPEAYALCERARALVRSMPEHDDDRVAGCGGSSLPVPFPNPDSSMARYQCTVQLLVCP